MVQRPTMPPAHAHAAERPIDRASSRESTDHLVCPKCGSLHLGDDVFASTRVCGQCGFHDREKAREAILRLSDPGSFREHDRGLFSSDPLRFEDETAYRERILQLRQETGESDALVSGFTRLGEHEIAIAALDFSFL